MSAFKTALVVMFVLANSANSYAAKIPGLLNTGFGLSDNIVDTNYAFSVVQGTAAGTGGHGVVTTNSEYPIATGEWMANTVASSWLAPSSSQGASYDQRTGKDGIYLWTYKFNLTGLASSTATLNARWASDNLGRLYFNGAYIPGADSTQQSTGWTNFSLNGGFLPGENSIQFEVINYVSRNTNPTGLRVEFLDSAASPVPEPASFVLLIVGLVGLANMTRKHGSYFTN